MFRFCDLPLEIQRMIYRLCMVNDTPISIEEDVPSDFEGNPLTQAKTFDNDELGRLTLNRFTARTFNINPNLLLVNSTVLGEARPMLYGLNIFRFLGQYSWIVFYHFYQRLSMTSRHYTRKLEFDFPAIVRTSSASCFAHADEIGLGILKQRSSNLTSLTFHLRDDIMSGDHVLLRKIRDVCTPKCQLVLDIHQAFGYETRAVWIREGIFQTIQKWGWEIHGDFELVDQRHRFSKERIWRKWLQKDRKKGIKSGVLEESRSFRGTSVFRWTRWSEWSD
ncbi:hypothetical protein G7Y79_00019g046420 [Physcia stellaris]|nr:hypothetical protein G7Y79_00019g046420 [Physcia stellaris]